MTLRLEQQLAHFADRSLAAGAFGYVLDAALHLSAGIRRGDAEAHAIHRHDVGEIVTDVGRLVKR